VEEVNEGCPEPCFLDEKGVQEIGFSGKVEATLGQVGVGKGGVEGCGKDEGVDCAGSARVMISVRRKFSPKLLLRWFKSFDFAHSDRGLLLYGGR
jgi:hypothetical protein